MGPFIELIEEMKALFQERDWDQFHSPKNLAISLSIEAAEVLEHFQWITEKESYQLNPSTLNEVRDEIGDVMILLVYLASKLGINPLEAAKQKLVKVSKKYPADQCKGKNLKYTHYETAQSLQTSHTPD